jgi:hypothetical protein
LARRSAFVAARRLTLTLLVVGVIAAVLRVRGRGGAPAPQGGWEELPFDQKR